MNAPVEAPSEETRAHRAAVERRTRQRRLTNLAAGALGLATLFGLGLWVEDRLTHVYVSDARIAATMISLSSRSAGWVAEVPVEEGATVPAGAVLVRLDDRRASLELDELAARVRALEAGIEGLRVRRGMIDTQSRSRLSAQSSRLEAARALLDARTAVLERAQADWERAAPLLERQAISRQEWERLHATWLEARSEAAAAGADVETARAAVVEIEAGREELRMIDDELVALEHRVEEARLQHDRQAVVVADHAAVAPVDGVIDEVFVDVGEYVGPGQRLLMLHDPAHLWVSANVKETDLGDLAVGTRALITVDAYPDRELKATLSRIGTAATSQFALLPNPNPSGNFTKITQRVEVRLDLEPTDIALRPGMMVEVKIDV
ncbi:MAG TPA: HlyD family secretion protein [Pseudomonadales bacterium]|nr:HlyD family secretion protein [Pseudomonadales bacterium]